MDEPTESSPPFVLTPQFPSIVGLVRLRRGTHVVGYERPTLLGAFHSRDGLWWHGTEIPHRERDAAIGHRDRAGRPLFVGDIVKGRVRRWFARERLFAVVCDTRGIGLLDLESQRRYGLELLTGDSELALASYVFRNPQLGLPD